MPIAENYPPDTVEPSSEGNSFLGDAWNVVKGILGSPVVQGVAQSAAKKYLGPKDPVPPKSDNSQMILIVIILVVLFKS